MMLTGLADGVFGSCNTSSPCGYSSVASLEVLLDGSRADALIGGPAAAGADSGATEESASDHGPFPFAVAFERNKDLKG
jgi:hypothetical protein